MLIREIIVENQFSKYIEDDVNDEAVVALVGILRALQYEAQDFAIPKISVKALVNLVKNSPEAEGFNLDALNSAYKSNELVKNLITNIKDDDNGVKYVYIKPLNDELEDELGDENSNSVGDGGDTKNPEKTVDSMAKRALKKKKK